MTGSPPDVDRIATDELRRLLIDALGKVAGLTAENAALREEIARLKGLKGRPSIKPSGMEKASEAEAAGRREEAPGSRSQADHARRDRGSGADGRSAGGLALQRLREFPDPGCGAAAGRHPVPPRALGNPRWPHGGGAASPRDRRPFRAGAAPLRAGAVSSGSGYRPTAGHAARGDRYRGFQAAGRAAA